MTTSPARILTAAGLVLAALAALVWTALPTQDIFEREREVGGLRDEFAPADAPFGPNELVTNFRDIAFTSEFKLPGAGDWNFIVKWAEPIRYEIIGETITKADTKVIDDLLARYRRLTGLEFSLVETDANFSIMILTADERDEVLDGLSQSLPAEEVDVYRRWSAAKEDPCVFQFYFDEAYAIIAAAVVIKAHYSELGRSVCLHEEMSQALGLGNDSYDARPSIFNDDHEFAYLTLHDEMLIRMLYDPRLRPGMEPAVAAQVLPGIARDVFSEMSR